MAGGLGIGYYAGISPTLSALIFAIITALGIDRLSHAKRIRQDSSIALFWAVGMAIGIIFIFLTPGYTPGLSEFLFGNILTITTHDIVLFALYTLVLTGYVVWQLNPTLRRIVITFYHDFMKENGITTINDESDMDWAIDMLTEAVKQEEDKDEVEATIAQDEETVIEEENDELLEAA